jgi:hypothetical protein
MSEDNDAALREVRQLLARTHAKHGLPGLLRLLPRDASAQLLSAANARGGAGGGWWRGLADLLASPEKLLFVLLCAFALLVLWDNWQAGSSCAGDPVGVSLGSSLVAARGTYASPMVFLPPASTGVLG